MKDFISNLSSPSWWAGVVIVGILINLCSAYLKPRLDRWFTGSSRWWDTRTEARRHYREARVQKLRESQHEQTMASLTALWFLLRSVSYSLLGVVSLLVGAVFYGTFMAYTKGHTVIVSLGIIIFAFIANVSFLMAVDENHRAARQRNELSEARGKEAKSHE